MISILVILGILLSIILLFFLLGMYFEYVSTHQSQELIWLKKKNKLMDKIIPVSLKFNKARQVLFKDLKISNKFQAYLLIFLFLSAFCAITAALLQNRIIEFPEGRIYLDFWEDLRNSGNYFVLSHFFNVAFIITFFLFIGLFAFSSFQFPSIRGSISIKFISLFAAFGTIGLLFIFCTSDPIFFYFLIIGIIWIVFLILCFRFNIKSFTLSIPIFLIFFFINCFLLYNNYLDLSFIPFVLNPLTYILILSIIVITTFIGTKKKSSKDHIIISILIIVELSLFLLLFFVKASNYPSKIKSSTNITIILLFLEMIVSSFFIFTFYGIYQVRFATSISNLLVTLGTRKRKKKIPEKPRMVLVFIFSLPFIGLLIWFNYRDAMWFFSYLFGADITHDIINLWTDSPYAYDLSQFSLTIKIEISRLPITIFLFFWTAYSLIKNFVVPKIEKKSPYSKGSKMFAVTSITWFMSLEFLIMLFLCIGTPFTGVIIFGFGIIKTGVSLLGFVFGIAHYFYKSIKNVIEKEIELNNSMKR